MLRIFLFDCNFNLRMCHHVPRQELHWYWTCSYFIHINSDIQNIKIFCERCREIEGLKPAKFSVNSKIVNSIHVRTANSLFGNICSVIKLFVQPSLFYPIVTLNRRTCSSDKTWDGSHLLVIQSWISFFRSAFAKLFGHGLVNLTLKRCHMPVLITVLHHFNGSLGSAPRRFANAIKFQLALLLFIYLSYQHIFARIHHACRNQLESSNTARVNENKITS